MNIQWLGRLTLKELATRTWRETNEDKILGHAAELAYYFLLALFPMLIFLTSLVGFLPSLREAIFTALARFVPGDAMRLMSDTLSDATRHRGGGLISFGVLGALWAASGGVAAVMGTLNAAYDAREERSIWKVRLIAVCLTITLALLVVGGTALVMFGDRLAAWLSAQLGMGTALTVVWSAVHYLGGFALLFLGLELIYYFGPNVEQGWKWVTPGAVFAVVSMVVASLLFSLYLRFAPDYSATYGSLGAVVVLMLWLYLMGAVILIGGEINSEIARAADVPAVQRETSSRPRHEGRLLGRT
ncbi:MAG TPA: YihY/virulence factor BrkB family protein [Blastocatellia bacterium]|jgi:Predicted membrane protein